jgi:hypothetical protein
MSDPNVSTAPTAPAVTPEQIKPVIDDVQADIALGLALVKAYKANGVSGATAQAPAVIAAVEKTEEDASAALPVIKAGYKTSEFWLVAILLAFNAVYTTVAGKALPLNVNILSGALVSVYAGLRTVAKSACVWMVGGMLIIGMSGCSTPQSAAFKVESGAETVVETALAGWNVYVGQYHPGTNVEFKVEQALNTYKASELLAIDATQAWIRDTNNVQTALSMQAEQAAQARTLADLLAVISTLTVTNK